VAGQGCAELELELGSESMSVIFRVYFFFSKIISRNDFPLKKKKNTHKLENFI
jgi:hypothetical protein